MGLTATEIAALLSKQSEPQERIKRTPRGFDRAALFLLELSFENLFEPVSALPGDVWTFRCKGCHKHVKRTSRKQHWLDHKREYEGND